MYLILKLILQVRTNRCNDNSTDLLMLPWSDRRLVSLVEHLQEELVIILAFKIIVLAIVPNSLQRTACFG